MTPPPVLVVRRDISVLFVVSKSAGAAKLAHTTALPREADTLLLDRNGILLLHDLSGTHLVEMAAALAVRLIHPGTRHPLL
jgi:hypothetical protein